MVSSSWSRGDGGGSCSLCARGVKRRRRRPQPVFAGRHCAADACPSVFQVYGGLLLRAVVRTKVLAVASKRQRRLPRLLASVLPTLSSSCYGKCGIRGC